ncbi:MAG: hypothetical protein AB2788_18585 [Candidatus Thiodiazotropha endolucinida]
MAEDNENRVETGQASVSDLSDEDLVINYCLQNKIAKGAIDELLKRGYTSLEALSLVDISDLVSPKIPRGQRRLIMHIAAALKGKTTAGQSTVGGTQSDGTANNGTAMDERASVAVSAETTGATNVSEQTVQPATVTTDDYQHGVPAISTGTANAGLRTTGTNENADIYQHVNNLLQQQNTLSVHSRDSNSQLPQASWSDPQIHISTASGKSASNFLDICDFIHSSVEEEVVLGGHGEQQVIVKSGPKKPRLENITLCQWSVANLAILYKLVGENKLQGPSLMDYLSYTTKIYQLVQRYSLVSVLLYDREYRKLQASLKFRWGTDVQHLSNIHLQAREKSAVQGSQQKKSQPSNKPFKNGKSKPDTVVCRNFNTQKGCTYPDCKFRHVCIIPGCNQSHSAISHSEK